LNFMLNQSFSLMLGTLKRCLLLKVRSSGRVPFAVRALAYASTMSSVYETVARGNLYSPNYRLFYSMFFQLNCILDSLCVSLSETDSPDFGAVPLLIVDASCEFIVPKQKNNQFISPWHDIPLYADENAKVYNMIVENPRWTNAKMEIATTEPMNPVKQDLKKGKVRFIDNCFPYHGYIWNYGALPQTWENPFNINSHTSANGDNDPIDACEIGQRVAKRGEVLQVKLLGLIALIDEGETDWKLIVIDVRDPLANKLHDITDVDIHHPGLLQATKEWLKIYKIPTGKPANKFGLNGMYQNKDFAANVIAETHEFWKKLTAKPENTELCCSTCTDDSHFMNKITQEEAMKIVASTPDQGEAEPIDPIVDTWHYISA
ncbi:Inorganic pyrophosphatase, partial [Trichinella patagoniensis]